MIFLCTQRLDYYENIQEYRESIDTKLSSFFLKMNIKLVFISMQNSKGDLSIILKEINPQGIILSGGNDIKKVRKRDILERRLIDYGVKKKIPVIGICRGMQMIAHYFGAKLRPTYNHTRTRHFVKSLGFSSNPSNKFIVNSYHQYGLLDCPKNFQILLKAEDSSIEAIKHNKLPILGIMWHPERFKIFREIDIKIIKSII